MRVLITGMSGTGKSTVITELRRRGHCAYDSDDDGFTAPDEAGVWHWRVDAVRGLFDRADRPLVFFAGCSEEQRDFSWDLMVLLTAPRDLLVERLASRATNSYGKSERELSVVMADLHTVEPLLRQAADTVIDTQQPVAAVTAAILAAAAPAGRQQ